MGEARHPRRRTSLRPWCAGGCGLLGRCCEGNHTHGGARLGPDALALLALDGSIGREGVRHSGSARPTGKDDEIGEGNASMTSSSSAIVFPPDTMIVPPRPTFPIAS